MDLERVQRGMILRRLRLRTNDAQRGARPVEVRGRGREQPVLQFAEQLAAPARPARSPRSDRGWRRRISSVGSGRLARRKSIASSSSRAVPLAASMRGHHSCAGEILARERELLEIILQQQPGALRIGAGREQLQNFLALGDARSWSRPVRGADPPARRRSSRARCDARRIWPRPRKSAAARCFLY